MTAPRCETSTNLGKAMVGISDVKGDAVTHDIKISYKEAVRSRSRRSAAHGLTETGLRASAWQVWPPCFPLHSCYYVL